MALAVTHRRFLRVVLFAAFGLVVTALLLWRFPEHLSWPTFGYVPSTLDWEHRPSRYGLAHPDLTPLPSGPPLKLPRIQYDFSKQPRDKAREQVLAQRRAAVKDALLKSWGSYRKYAWGHDELMALSAKGADPYSGWGATLVDSLDTLWIAGLKSEFNDAVQAVRTINWDASRSDTCSLFETNIRYLGGLLAAYGLSGEKTLLRKATELGHMLYAAFDTPNGMPVNAFHFGNAWAGNLQPEDRGSIATVGTLSMEFTRLSQLTGNTKFYSAIDRIKNEMLRTQDLTLMPGMWPKLIDLKNNFGVGEQAFTLGGSADSAYEYLSKMYLLLGGRDASFAEMHKRSMEAARKNLLFRPMLPPPADQTQPPPDVLFFGTAWANKARGSEMAPEVEHLNCFTGGMLALGGKVFGLDEHVEIGEKLARGCAWVYSATATGIMPDSSLIMPCKAAGQGPCQWDEAYWKAEGSPTWPRGFMTVRDFSYKLRPEAIESLFVLYRITGKRDLQDLAWTMFESIKKGTETEFGFSTIPNVMLNETNERTESMESFWIAETLKYLYLIFSEPDVISLDDYVFNTEAHPFPIPKPKK